MRYRDIDREIDRYKKRTKTDLDHFTNNMQAKFGPKWNKKGKTKKTKLEPNQKIEEKKKHRNYNVRYDLV